MEVCRGLAFSRCLAVGLDVAAPGAGEASAEGDGGDSHAQPGVDVAASERHLEKHGCLRVQVA